MHLQKIKLFIRENFLIYFTAILIAFFIVNIEKNKIKVLESQKSKYTDNFIVVDKGVSTELLFLKLEITEKKKGLPTEFRYTNINEAALKRFLESWQSILIDEPYFSTIISASKDMDVHPLLMFAVLGQEQGFVPRNNKYALKIANNPFNVFGSWQKYNTNIKDSSEIAARTLINLSKDKPQDEDLLKWINLRGGQGGYAEDENWWLGVKSMFERLKNNTQ